MRGRQHDSEELGSPTGDGPRLPGSAHEGFRAQVASLLRRHGLVADKRLGQHFLASASVVEAIVLSVDGLEGILEIGPGPGILTGPLAAAHPVVAVELDERVLGALAESAPNASVYRADALEADLREIIQSVPAPRAVVSNMPYNITGPLLDRVCGMTDLFDRAVLMMQREVAERILAPAGDRRRGALSVVIQSLFDVTKLCNVPPGAFLPPPKVDSTVLVLRPVPSRTPTVARDGFRWLHAGFAQPRKTLANNLRGTGVTTELITGQGLSPTVRPHELTLDQWEALARAHFKL